MTINERAVYLLKCLKNYNDASFREKIISIGRDGRLMYFSQYGELNPDKRFYLIDFSGISGLGMCAFIRFTLDKLIYADFHGCIPVVFWGKYTYYSEKEDSQLKIDAFTKYYQPINPQYIDEVNHSFWVCKSTMGDHLFLPSQGSHESYLADENEILRYAQVFQKYFKESDSLKKYLAQSSFQLRENTLGVHVRGTDYNKNFKNHPVAITTEQYIEETKRLMDSGRYSTIFLATDDATVVQRFDKIFPGKVVYYTDAFRSENNEAVHGSFSTRNRHEFMLGLEVLRDVYTLVECSGLIASVSNVPTLSRIIKKARNLDYSDCRILYLGENHTGPKFSDPRH